MPKYFYDTEFIERGRGFPIELISIGIVCDDGRQFYAISSEFDPDHAGDWVKEHVLIHLPPKPDWVYMNLDLIALNLIKFIDPKVYGRPEFWAYYGAYDHVVFCQIFGTMATLPEGFPMHTNDIKQWAEMLGNARLPKQVVDKHHALADARWTAQAWGYLDQIAKEQAWLSTQNKERLL